MLAGSEGALGVITEAWVRVQPRPSHRALGGRVASQRFSRRRRVRARAQPVGPEPGQLPPDRRARGAHDDGRRRFARAARARLRVRPTTPSTRRCRGRSRSAPSTAARSRGRSAPATRPAARTPWAPGARRSSARPTCATCSSRWACSRRRSRRRSRGSASPRFHERVTAAGRAGAVRDACGEGGQVHCRFTHVYPDGPAVYFTVIAPARRGEEVAAVGGDQARRCPTRSSPRAARSPTTTPSGATTARGMTASARTPFAAALRGAKAAVDPHGDHEPRRADRSAAIADGAPAHENRRARPRRRGRAARGGARQAGAERRAWSPASRPRRRSPSGACACGSVTLGELRRARPRAVARAGGARRRADRRHQGRRASAGAGAHRRPTRRSCCRCSTGSTTSRCCASASRPSTVLAGTIRVEADRPAAGRDRAHEPVPARRTWPAATIRARPGWPSWPRARTRWHPSAG